MPALRLGDGWKRLILPATVALVLIADQVSKNIIVNNLQIYQEWAPIPALQWLFAITYITNTGAAFGIFPQGSSVFIVIAVVVVIALLIYQRQIAAHQRLLHVSLGLQLGGAMGNLVDRLTRGHVVDFLYFKFWPIFNVADASIVVGVALMAYFLLQEGKEGPGERGETVAEGHEKENAEQNLSATP